MASGVVVYLALAAILLLMWWQMRGSNFADPLARDLHLHHQVHKFIALHPKGSSWQEYQRWMKLAM